MRCRCWSRCWGRRVGVAVGVAVGVGVGVVFPNTMKPPLFLGLHRGSRGEASNEKAMHSFNINNISMENKHIRPYPRESTGSRPLSPSQTRERGFYLRRMTRLWKRDRRLQIHHQANASTSVIIYEHDGLLRFVASGSARHVLSESGTPGARVHLGF